MKKNILFKLVILMMALCSSTKIWADEQGKAYVTVYTTDREIHFYYCPPGTTNTVSPYVGPTYEINDKYNGGTPETSNLPQWYKDNSYKNVRKVIIEPSFAEYRPKSTAYWLYGYEYVNTIEGLEYLNTSEVTDMTCMFSYCYGLKNIDVSHFDTQNVEDMSYLFNNCQQVTSLNISEFNTSKVKNMRNMFAGCNNLEEIDVSGFDTQNVEDMSCLFSGCKKIKSIDVTGFNTEKVTKMFYLFYDCESITELDLRSFVTYNVTDMENMFTSCISLVTIYVTRDSWNTNKIGNSYCLFRNCTKIVGEKGTTYDFSARYSDKIYAHIDGGPDNPGYLSESPYQPGLSEPYAVLFGEILTFYYDNLKNQRSGIVYTEFRKSKDDSWGVSKENISYVTFDNSFKDYHGVTLTRSWFRDCNNLKEVTNLSNLNTENVTDMAQMFTGCTNLETADVSHFDTRNVTNMAHMFYQCHVLKTIDVSQFKTANVKNMKCMFAECNIANSLDVSGFETGNVTDMSFLFYNCKGIKTLDVSHFQTNNITNMKSMFYNCENVSIIDVSGFETNKVTDMSYMFCSCQAL